MPPAKPKGDKRYGITLGKEFTFVIVNNEAEALEAGRLKLLRKAEDKLRGNEKPPAELLDRDLFKRNALVHLSTRE